MKRAYLVLVPAILAMLTIMVERPAHAQTAPIQITNCQDLQNIGNTNYVNANNQAQPEPLSGNYQLANDIDCSATKTWNNGFGFIPIDSYSGNASAPVFTGVLDGGGHTINNLNINASNINLGSTGPVSVGTESPMGVFSVTSGAIIENVNVANASVTGGQYNIVAILAGYAQGNTVIQNVQVQGTVVAGNYAYTGGLIGSLESSLISQSSADIDITGGNYTVGGLVGYSSNGTVDESYAEGDINTHSITGGLLGTTEYGNSISNSYSDVDINFTCDPQGSYYSGGVAGLVGNSYDPASSLNINDSYVSGPITAEGSNCAPYQLGGLVASALHIPAVTSSYWDAQVTGQYSSVGSSASAGLTTAKMYLKSSYVGWDFAHTWISDNDDYPELLWQEKPLANLWNTFSAASQVSAFETASPPNTIDWSFINAIGSLGVNWTDLLVLSKPSVWSYASATAVSGFANSVNWTYLGSMYSNPINWVDVGVMSRTGIDWGSVNPLRHSGVNWSDWVVATWSGINWNAICVIGNQGINWTSIGLTHGKVDWANLAGMSHRAINWTLFGELSRSNVNWQNPALLNEIPITPTNFNVLKTIGVKSKSTVSTAELVVNLTGAAAGTITSSPGGINCTTGSSNGCLAAFPIDQRVTLNFSSINGSSVTNWGGCPSATATSCSLTPDQSLVLNIAVNPPVSYMIAASVQGMGGTISPSGSVSVISGQNQTFTMTAASGYAVYNYTIDGNMGGGSLYPTSTLSYTFDNVTSNHTIQTSFIHEYNLSILTKGNGEGVLTNTVPPTSTFTCLDNSSGAVVSCSGNYYSGTTITVAATPDSLSSFKGWTGIPGCSTKSACTFTIGSNINATAEFDNLPNVVSLNIQDTGAGAGIVASSPLFTTCGINVLNGGTASCTGNYVIGTVVKLTATPTNVHSVFSKWTGIPGCSTQNPCTFIIHTNLTATASFVPTYTITTSTYGAGTGTVLCNGTTCPAYEPAGTSVSFTAKPDTGSIFESWGNSCTTAGGTSNGATCTVNNISSNISLLAIWGIAPPNYTITTSTAGPGNGKVLCNGSTCPASVPSGTVVTFTGKPNNGSVLEGLGGVCAAPGGPIFTCPFEVTSNISVSAYFIKSPPPAPVNLKAVKSGTTGISLSWTNQYGVSNNVYRALLGVNGNRYTLIAHVGYPNTTYTDTSMPKDGQYYYYVTGIYYPDIESPRSNAVTFTWKYQSLPSVPTGLKPTTSAGEVTLTWNTSTGADAYYVKRALVGTGGKLGAYSVISSPLSNPLKTTTSINDRTVVRGKTYYYMVAAYNDKGTSAYSPAVSIVAK